MRLTAQAATHGREATLYRRRLAGIAREQQAVAVAGGRPPVGHAVLKGAATGVFLCAVTESGAKVYSYAGGIRVLE